METMNLTQLESGQSGEVVFIEGGRNMTCRLSVMGIRVGVTVTKITSQLMRGPVSIQVGGTQLAIGYGMARRIIVEVDE
ncbi:ferrous iron transport protein A [candidate division TA06 bacterium]|uniref:Ferrous iron transport protein A n=1 Tax=candidate division TA06 bacterium TaxID=2250710 RepID=A0A523XJA1_UNCT6|nr:MAG: ferrous iron transport protein A [candidate division TA06 bacterium]